MIYEAINLVLLLKRFQEFHLYTILMQKSFKKKYKSWTLSNITVNISKADNKLFRKLFPSQDQTFKKTIIIIPKYFIIIFPSDFNECLQNLMKLF